MLAVGLDLAGVETRPSGFCVLKDMKAETLLLYSDREIIAKIRDLKPEIIAVDAPLSLPAGRNLWKNDHTSISENATESF